MSHCLLTALRASLLLLAFPVSLFAAASDRTATAQAGAASAAAVVSPAQKELDELLAQQARRLHELQQEVDRLARQSRNNPSDASLAKRVRRYQAELSAIRERIAKENAEIGRTRYITPRTTDPLVKDYYAGVEERIEALGTKEFPKDNQGRSIYGRVIVHFAVLSDGTVEKLEVKKSDSQELSQHAMQVIRGVAPFEPFPPAMASQLDRLVITAPFTYENTSP